MRCVNFNQEKTLLLATCFDSTVHVFDIYNGYEKYSAYCEYDMSVFPADKEWLELPSTIFAGYFLWQSQNEFITAHQDMAMRKWRFVLQSEPKAGRIELVDIYKGHYDSVRNL